MRITIDIAKPVAIELQQFKTRNGGTVSDVVNALLAEALTPRRSENTVPKVEWFSRPMRARVNLAEKDAVCALADETNR